MQSHHKVKTGGLIPTMYHYFVTLSPNTTMHLFHFCITLNVASQYKSRLLQAQPFMNSHLYFLLTVELVPSHVWIHC